MARVSNPSRLMVLLRSIASMMAHPIPEDEGRLKAHRREVHFMMGANPIFIPKKTKVKGYKKDATRDNRYNKFKKH